MQAARGGCFGAAPFVVSASLAGRFSPRGGAPPSESAAAPADLGAGPDAALFHARHPRTTAYGETPDRNSSDGIGAWVSTAEAARIRASEPSEMRLRPWGLAVSQGDVLPNILSRSSLPFVPST